jgi:hypothetical protein
MFIVELTVYDEANPLNIAGDFTLEISGTFYPAKRSFSSPEDDFIDIENVSVIKYPEPLSNEELKRLDRYFLLNCPIDLFNKTLELVVAKYK